MRAGRSPESRLAALEQWFSRLQSWATTPSGGPAPGTPAYNPAWYALTDVYLDPVAGNDAASGKVGFPVKTMAEVVRRYGSATPQLVYGQSLTVHQLSAQPAGVDAFVFAPIISGSGNFIWLAVPTAIGAPFAVGAITAKVQTAAGNDLKGAGMPAGAAIGQIVQNVARGSYAMILALAAGTATFSQPVASAGLLTVSPFPAYVEDNGWTTGDMLQLYQPLTVNMKSMLASGGDANGAGTSGTYWLQAAQIADGGGAPSDSNFGVIVNGTCWNAVLCNFQAFLSLDATQSYSATLGSCVFAGSVDNIGAVTFAGGCLTGKHMSLLGFASVDGDFSTPSLTVGESNAFLGLVHVQTSLRLQSGSSASIEAVSVGNLVWGGATANIVGGAVLLNGTGGLWANCLKLTALQIDGATSFDTYLPSSGTWVDHAGPLTSALIDTGGGAGGPGAQNARTGSKYASP